MRILHLAYEDPLQPGAGGGSIRTLEINRRLARRNQVTAIVANYPGATRRTQDGIEWVPVGPQTGTKLDRLSYFALVAPHVIGRRFDLLVEEFAAPFGPGLGPLLTRAPIIGSVQWLFAHDMRKKYHLPFDWIESIGLRYYRRFIAVSNWLAEQLRSSRPNAKVHVIPNGVDSQAFVTCPSERYHLTFLGRLDRSQKGLDLLVDIMRRIRHQLGSSTPQLLVVGDGPDRDDLARRLNAEGLSDLVELLGTVGGQDKYEILASSHAVLMPSRFETFGLVAAETIATGTPLVAFDVGPLAEVTGPQAIHLVKPFDLDAFAAEVVEIVTDPSCRSATNLTSRTWARRYDWDAIAAQQEMVYHQALNEGR